jgi:hypothetical protein
MHVRNSLAPVALATICLLDLPVSSELCLIQHILHDGGLGVGEG